jgi:hypothetical protein
LDEDLQVGQSEVLWRRVHKDHYIDGRITTAAFKDYSMSVDVARLCPGMWVTLGNGVGVASFSSAVAYDNGQDVRLDPVEGNEAHAVVIGNKPRSTRKAFCEASDYTPRTEIERP